MLATDLAAPPVLGLAKHPEMSIIVNLWQTPLAGELSSIFKFFTCDSLPPNIKLTLRFHISR
jgi:hypothetical protein